MLNPFDGGTARGGEAAPVPEHVDLHALIAQLRHLLRDVLLEQVHERGDLERRTVPVFVGEGKQGQHFHAGLDRAFDRFANGFHPGAVAERTGQPAFTRPAAIAVHDDRHVARNRTGEHQTSMISASLALTAASTAFRCSS